MRTMLPASTVCGRRAVAAASRPKWFSGIAKAIGLIGFSFASLMIADGGQAHASQGCSFINGQALTDDLTLENYEILEQLFDVGDEITIHNISNPKNETVVIFNIDFNYVVAQGIPTFTFSIQQSQLAGRSIIIFDSPSINGPFATAIVTCKAASTFTLKQTQSPVRRVGQSYSQTNVVHGGTAPYAYSVSAGILPAGTTLNTSTGEVSGTPTTAGLFSYTIEVTDSTTPTPLTVKQTLSRRILPP